MIRIAHKLLFFAFIAIVVLSLAFSLKTFSLARAATQDELSGWAWSSNIGWISFNSTNCDTDSNGFVDTGFCGGDNTTQAVKPYGVTTVTTSTPTVKKLAGWAWSSNIGWIAFDEAQLSGRSALSINLVTGSTDGWARAYTCINPGCQGAPNGWDGWIHFAGPGYASPNLTGSGGVTLNTAVCKLMGYAWAGGDDTNFPGWIHFAGSGYQVGLNPSVCGAAAVSVTLILTAAPPVGDTPLSVQLTANIIDAPGVGNITYTFDCDSGDDGPGDPTPPSANGTNNTFACSYAARSRYTGWVKADQAGALSGNATASIFVKPAPPQFKEVPPQ